jgi:RNA polymerase sigma-70 factor (ECF subfamily)
MEQAALLAGFKQGDERCLDGIYRLHAPMVRRLLRRMLRHRRFADAGSTEEQDLLQEVFLRAFRPETRARFDVSRSFRPYLMGIARNLLRDYFDARRREVAFRRSLEREDASGEATALAPLHTLDLLALRRLATVVECLSPQARELIRVRFVEDASLRDSASALGCSYQQIRTRELKLRLDLRSRLTAPGG